MLLWSDSWFYGSPTFRGYLAGHRCEPVHSQSCIVETGCQPVTLPSGGFQAISGKWNTSDWTCHKMDVAIAVEPVCKHWISFKCVANVWRTSAFIGMSGIIAKHSASLPRTAIFELKRCLVIKPELLSNLRSLKRKKCQPRIGSDLSVSGFTFHCYSASH